jgi:hypothetical protein
LNCIFDNRQQPFQHSNTVHCSSCIIRCLSWATVVRSSGKRCRLSVLCILQMRDRNLSLLLLLVLWHDYILPLAFAALYVVAHVLLSFAAWLESLLCEQGCRLVFASFYLPCLCMASSNRVLVASSGLAVVTWDAERLQVIPIKYQPFVSMMLDLVVNLLSKPGPAFQQTFGTQGVLTDEHVA